MPSVFVVFRKGDLGMSDQTMREKMLDRFGRFDRAHGNGGSRGRTSKGGNAESEKQGENQRENFKRTFIEGRKKFSDFHIGSMRFGAAFYVFREEKDGNSD